MHDTWYDGLHLEGNASAVFDGVNIIGSPMGGYIGANILGDATAAFNSGRISQCSPFGIYSGSSASLTVTGTEIDTGGGYGINLRGMMKAPSRATITAASLHQLGVGIQMDAYGGDAPQVVIVNGGTTIDNTGSGNAISVGSANYGWNLKVRDSTFRGPILADIGASTNASNFDFGTSADKGNNTFWVTGFGIFDERPTAQGGTITVIGNNWYSGGSGGGTVPAPQPCTPAPGDTTKGHPAAPSSWYIVNPGTCPASGTTGSTGNVIFGN